MIELTTDVGLLRRFVLDLDRTAPGPTPSAPDLTAHAAADREAARLAWASRIVDEYRSVAVFSELLGLLADLEAPYPALCAVHRLIGDELRHTQVTAQVVEWLGGHADLAIDLSEVGLPPREDSKAVRALHVIARELVAGEEESIYALAAYRDATTEPAIRAVLVAILADEVRHAAAGRALLALFERGPLAEATVEARAELPVLLATDRATLRDAYRRAAVGGPGRALGACLAEADLDAIWRRA